MKVKILVSFPKFVGTDMKEYAGQEVGDIVDYPDNLAYLLIKWQKAMRIEQISFHECEQLKQANKSQRNTSEEWDIRKVLDEKEWELVVNDEYGIYIAICPFCGVKL